MKNNDSLFLRAEEVQATFQNENGERSIKEGYSAAYEGASTYLKYGDDPTNDYLNPYMLKIAIETMKAAQSVKKWVTFWSILSIINTVILVIAFLKIF